MDGAPISPGDTPMLIPMNLRTRRSLPQRGIPSTPARTRHPLLAGLYDLAERRGEG